MSIRYKKIGKQGKTLAEIALAMLDSFGKLTLKLKICLAAIFNRIFFFRDTNHCGKTTHGKLLQCFYKYIAVISTIIRIEEISILVDGRSRMIWEINAKFWDSNPQVVQGR